MGKIILKNIIHRKWSFIVTILINIVALSMIAMSVYIYENTTYCEKIIDKSMRYDIDNIGIITVGNLETEEGYMYDDMGEISQSMVNELKENDKIISVGAIGIEEGFDNSDIAKIQHELIDNEDNKNNNDDDELLHYYGMDSGIMDMFNIELTEGSIDKTIDTSDELTNYVYLGEGYKKKYKVGDVIDIQYKNDIHYRMIVNGFFSSKGIIAEPNVISTTAGFTSDKCCFKLKDSDVIIVHNMAYNGAVCFMVWNDNYSYDEIQNEVNKLAKRYDKTAHVVKLSKIIKEKVKEGNEISGYIMDVLWIILVTAVIMVTCIQITNILNNTSQYGIMYANGFSAGSIMTMLAVETFLNTIIAAVMSIVVVKKLIKFIFTAVTDENEVIDYIFKEYVIGVDILAAFIISIVSIVIPMIIIYRMKPVQLIGGEDT